MECLYGVAHADALFAEVQLPAHLLAGTDVEFRDVDVLHERGIEREGVFKLLYARTEDVVVPLHTDAVDGHSLASHTQHHLVDVAALAAVALVVVVVEEDGLGVSLTSELEGFGDELVTAELVELGLTVGILAAVAHGFVHHVPGIDDILVAVHHRLDVVFQPCIEDFLIDKVALVVIVHPFGELVVPDEAVAAHPYPVLAAEVGNAVCLFPSPHIGGGMERRWLHGILARHAVELLADEVLLSSNTHIAPTQRDAHKEILGKGFLEALRHDGDGTDGEEKEKKLFHWQIMGGMGYRSARIGLWRKSS